VKYHSKTLVRNQYNSGIGQADVDFETAIELLIGDLATTNGFIISVDGNAPVSVSLATIDVTSFSGSTLDPSTTVDSLAEEIAKRIQEAYTDINVLGISVIVSFEPGPTPVGGLPLSALLRIASGKGDNTGSAVITPGGSDDATGPLMLGTAQGGLEVTAYSAHRPAANGLTFDAPVNLINFANVLQDSITDITLDELDGSGNTVPVDIPFNLVTMAATDKMYTAALGYSVINDDND